MAQRLALIVAPRYFSNQWLTSLDGTRLLPTRLQEVLTAHGHYNQIIMELADKEVKRGQLRSQIKQFFQNQGELLFYFYGHGVRREPQEGVLATSDSEPDDEGVPMGEVVALANASPASEVVLIFDCCHAGAAAPATANVVPYNSVRPDQARSLIAACAEHEHGWEMPIDDRRKLGALSTCVLEGLNGGAKNNKGEVTATGLGQYVLDTFASWRQHPIWAHSGSTALPCKLTWDFPVIPALRPSRVRSDYYEHLKYPPHYLPRQELLEYVRQLLLTEASNTASTSTIQIYALHGMGGIGKTVMARSLCDELAVQNRFSDGILVATMGIESSEAELSYWLGEWIDRLGRNITKAAPSLISLTNTLAELLYERDCLLILNNVWHQEQVEPFLISAPRCRLLLTTRIAQIARNLGAQIVDVPVLDSTQAVTLLEKWAAGELAVVDINVKKNIVERLGHLALAVQLAGGRLQYLDPQTWLEEFKIRGGSDPDILASTLSLSLDVLDPTQRKLYAALTIFNRGEPIPEAAIIMLWKGLADYKASQTRGLLDYLHSIALLQINRGQSKNRNSLGSWTAILHDMLYEVLFEELNVTERVQSHQALIESYRITQTGKGWHTAQDDGYLYKHLAYHLAAITDQHSAALAELTALFANDRWLQVRVISSGHLYDDYLTDLQVLWERLTRCVLVECESGDTTTIAACVRCALIHTSVNSLASNHVPELVKEAVVKGIWSITRVLAIANRVPDPEQRVQFYLQLLTLAELTPNQQQIIITQGLLTVQAIKDEEFRVVALIALAPHLTGELFGQALATVQLIQKDAPRARGLALLASHVNGNEKDHLLAQALAATLAVEDEGNRIAPLEILAPHLTDELLTQTLSATQSIRKEENRVWVMTILAPRLTGELLAQGLTVVKAIQEEELRVRSLVALAPYLKDELLAQGLTIAQEIKDARAHVTALAALLPHLNNSLHDQVLAQGLTVAQAIIEAEVRVRSLAALLPYLSSDVKVQALMQGVVASQGIKDEWARVSTLESLTPYLQGELPAQVLAIVPTLKEAGARARLLASLSLCLPDDLKIQAADQELAAVQAIKETVMRSRALAVLAPRLTNDIKVHVIAKELTTVKGIVDEGQRAAALAALAPHLTDELLTQGLIIARSIKEVVPRTRAFVALAPYLSRELLTQELAAARTIEELSHAEALAVLTPYLPDEMKIQVLSRGLVVVNAIQEEELRARALAALTPHLTDELLNQGLIITRSIRSKVLRVRALIAFIPCLTGDAKGEIIAQALEAAQAIQHDADRAEALAALATYLTDDIKVKMVTLALELTPAIREERLRAKTLATLAPHLTDSVLIDNGLVAAQTIMDAGERVKVLAAFIPYLSNATKTQIVTHALTVAKTIEEKRSLAQALVILVPYLTDSIKAQIIAQALLAVQAIEEEWSFAEALWILAPYLTDKLHTEAVATAQSIKEDGPRAVALAALFPLVVTTEKQPVRTMIHSAIVHHLAALQNKKRADVLSFLTEKALFVPAILNTSTLTAIANHVNEICSDWRWL